MIRTLNGWGIDVDALFLLGGMDKDKILSILRPHMFLMIRWYIWKIFMLQQYTYRLE